MLHEPLEFKMPSMAAGRNQRMNRKPLAAEETTCAADESVRLIEAIDEAFAVMPSSESDTKKPADMHRQTESLAGLLAMQLQELDQQRGRLASLLEQIAKPTVSGK